MLYLKMPHENSITTITEKDRKKKQQNIKHNKQTGGSCMTEAL